VRPVCLHVMVDTYENLTSNRLALGGTVRMTLQVDLALPPIMAESAYSQDIPNVVANKSGSRLGMSKRARARS
jgi:hypothetical protein